MNDLMTITNSEFLDAIFGTVKPDERIWVAWFKTPPNKATEMDWAGTPAAKTDNIVDRLESNNYFSVSTVKDIDGKFKRRKVNFCRMSAVVVDDAITTNAASWKLQTSIGKFQVGFILSQDITDIGVASRLQQELGRQKLVPADNNGYNPVRYVRLPRGVNTNYGEPIQCRLLEWNPEQTYSIESLCKEFDLNFEFIINGGSQDAALRASVSESDSELIAAIVSGQSYHDQINKLAARYRARGMAYSNIIVTIRGLMEAAPVKDARWENRYNDIPRATQGAFEKFDAAPPLLSFSSIEHQPAVEEGVAEPSPQIFEIKRSSVAVATAIKMIGDAEDFDALLEKVIPAIRKLTGITYLDLKSIAKTISTKATSLKMVINRRDAEQMIETYEMKDLVTAKHQQHKKVASADGSSVRGVDPLIREILSWMFIESDNSFYNPNDGRQVSRVTFNLLYSSAPIPASGDEKPKADEFFISAGGRVCYNLIFLPHLYNAEDRIVFHNGLKCLNTYRPANIPDIPDNWASKISWRVFRDHLVKVFGDDSKLIIEYLAHNVQFPGVKVRWCLLIKGVQGDGKTTISRVLSIVMGDGAVRVVSNEALQSQFNGWAFGACVVALEEVRAIGHSRYDVLNKLKPIVTNDVIEIIRKGKDGFEIPNVTNMIAMTNHEDALPVGEEDRRFGIVFSKYEDRAKVNEEMPSEYFDQLYEVILGDPGSIRGWLMSIDLSEFNRHRAPPMTDGKQKMAINSATEDVKLIRAALEFDYKGLSKEYVDTYILNMVIEEHGGRKLNSARMAIALKAAGWVRYGQIKISTGFPRVVYFDPSKVCPEHITTDEIREKLKASPNILDGSTGYGVARAF